MAYYKNFNFIIAQHDSIPLTETITPLIEIINDIVPVLNGRDSENNVAYLGPNKTMIHRYLIILYVAKFIPTFTLWGENFGKSTFFTIYSLSNVAKAFKRPINFDRSKAATKIYRKAEQKGLVKFKKFQGKTYVSTTDKGDEHCLNFLRDFVAWARIHGVSSPNNGLISKGANVPVITREASDFYKNMVLNIDKFNSDFREEIDMLSSESEGS